MKPPKIGQLVRMRENHFGIKYGRIGLIVNQFHNYAGNIKSEEYGIYFPDNGQYSAWIYAYEFDIIDDPIKSYRGIANGKKA